MEARYHREPAYSLRLLHAIGYNWSAVLASGAEYLVSSDGCWGRFLTADRAAIPPPTHPLHGRFVTSQSFYKGLLDGSAPFECVQTFAQGSGPEVRVFRRKGDAR
jgi:hypothetical protein